MKKRWDSILIGRACIDILTQVVNFPPEDSKIAVSGWKKAGGGQASTCSCLMASLGGRVAFIGRLGIDAEGDMAIAEMEKYGVDCSFVKRDPSFSTPGAFIAINQKTGSRTIFCIKRLLTIISPKTKNPISKILMKQFKIPIVLYAHY